MPWDILSHEWAAGLLAQHIARKETRHAYLFCGPQGVGRRTLALQFAQALNCRQPPAPGQACGACRDCTQFAAAQHPDLALIQAVDDEGIPVPAGSIKIEQVRAVTPALSLAPYQSVYRVALFLRFEEATREAQNALLKTLEEAPDKAVLLLTADSAENLLPTIVSRCEVLRLRPLAVERLSAALHARWGLVPAEARRLAHLSGGRPGIALRLHQDAAAQEKIKRHLDDLLLLLGQSKRERFRYAEKNFKGAGKERTRDKLRAALTTWLSFFRDLLLVASGAEAPLTHLDQEEDLRRIARQVELPRARALLADAEQALQTLDGNANVQLLAEVLLLDWPRIA